ncbi:MAG: asparagine synthase-related protein [Desulfobacterales bacterium]
MSAIAGIVSQRGKLERDCAKIVGNMLGVMRHRGPDNMVVRSLLDDRGAVGANEILLTPDKTHCSSLDDYPYILFTGGIYNERPEGATDVDVVKDYYDKYDYRHECFSRLDGGFTCAIIEKDEEVVLVRDHVGAMPVFYGFDNDVFYFSSEMKALKDHLQFDVHELPPGYIYSSRKGMKEFDRATSDLPELPGNISDAAKILKDLLVDAVRKRMDGVGGVSLSGGLDSSIIAVIAKEFNPDIELFTGCVKSAPGPDLENARLMADFLGLKHHICEIEDQEVVDFIPRAVWHLESFDEDCISGIISNHFVSKLVKQYTSSILVGEGADELFGGYRMVLKNPKVKSEQQRERIAQKLLDIAYNTALRRLDRAWMSNSVNYRMPFLDIRVVDFSQKIPMKWKIHGENQVEKFILREAFRDMLPEKIANREKLRFAMGTGMDDVMDRLVSQFIDTEEIKARPKAAYGLPFASFKELYYYDEFLKSFPPSYEQQTVRWDPFK